MDEQKLIDILQREWDRSFEYERRAVNKDVADAIFRAGVRQAIVNIGYAADVLDKLFNEKGEPLWRKK